MVTYIKCPLAARGECSDYNTFRGALRENPIVSNGGSYVQCNARKNSKCKLPEINKINSEDRAEYLQDEKALELIIKHGLAGLAQRKPPQAENKGNI